MFLNRSFGFDSARRDVLMSLICVCLFADVGSACFLSGGLFLFL